MNFKEPVRLSKLRKHDSHVHFEKVKRDNGADAYCMKEETRIEGPWEYGIKPVKRASAVDWEQVKEKAKEGKFSELPADIFVKHYGNLCRIRKDNLVVDGALEDVKGVWLHGAAGNGKSQLARERYPESYKKLANKWWDGYNGQKFVLLEDLDVNHDMLGYHIKLWADKYHCLGETKGGMVALCHEKLVVTSQYHPD